MSAAAIEAQSPAQPTPLSTDDSPVISEDDWEAPESKRPWRSGFCNVQPCTDGDPDAGLTEQIRRCRHYSVNGVRASAPYVVCTCACHAQDSLPDMSDIVAEWRAAQNHKPNKP